MANIVGFIADIGATNARFAAVSPDGVLAEKTLACMDYPGFAEAAASYLDMSGLGRPSRAAIAIAGPVKGDQFKMTNHPWSFSLEGLKQALGLKGVRLMNDFEAQALAIPHLQAADIRPIGEGEALPNQPIGVIGPGTGLGVASIVWDGGKYIAVPGEGGHVTMAAKTQREFDIFQHMISTKYSHVSAERVCSGKGLVNLYNTICELDGKTDLPALEPAEISQQALEGTCPVCKEVIDLMIGFLGRTAGDLALTIGAYGGIYIAGGIVSKLGEYFYNSNFREEFEDKGRFKDYMRALPTYVIERPMPAFLGLQDVLLREAA